MSQSDNPRVPHLGNKGNGQMDDSGGSLDMVATASSPNKIAKAEECRHTTSGYELDTLHFPLQRRHIHPRDEQKQPSKREQCFLDNIIVGYAFGPKKMETMGLIMAEASKALSTFVAPTMSADALATMMTTQQQSSTSLDLCDESSMATTAATTLTNHAMAGVGGDENARGHYFSDNEEDARSFSSTRSSSVISQRSQRGGGICGGGIQLTFLPDSSGFVHLFRTTSTGVGAEGDQSVAGSSVTTMATTVSPYWKHGASSSSCSSMAFPSSSPLNKDKTQVKRKSFSSRYSSSSGNNELQRHPIRVSFVPIDLDTPLEEQHGGKFDVILHKMTEDILCMSNMFRSRIQLHNSAEPDGGGWLEGEADDEEMDISGLEDMHASMRQTGVMPIDPMMDATNPSDPHTYSRPVTMSRHQARAVRRIRRLREYKQTAHPSCVIVDSPTNILAVISRKDMADVLSKCLSDVSTKGGIPVRTPRFRVVEEGEEFNVALEREPGNSSEPTPIQNQYLADEIDSAGFEYPLIAKPLTAAGTKSSHHMGIVMARDGLRRLKTPCLLQEYANHGGKLFKVYVLGDSVWVFARQSLPNLPIGEREVISEEDDRGHKRIQNDKSGREDAQLPFHRSRRTESYVEFERPAGSRCYVEFNSQRPYPKLSDFGITEAIENIPKESNPYEDIATSEKEFSKPLHYSLSDTNEGCAQDSSPSSKKQRLDRHTLESCCDSGYSPMAISEKSPDLASFVTVDEIEPVTTALRAAFGLELFGFDVLVKHDKHKHNMGVELGNDDKEILVVDVNYFPGYKEVSNFPSLLAQYLTQKAVESRVRNLDSR